MGQIIRYLEPEEKEKARTLWSQAFFEDSEEFDQYYFTEKIKDNQILVKEEDGAIISMVHLNPYKIRLGTFCAQINYIVGVATDDKRRHQGHMRDLLSKMLQDGWEKGEPFTFLMPADRAIYEPFGFRFIFDKPQNQLKSRISAGCGAERQRENLRIEEYMAGALLGNRKLIKEIAGFMETWLSERFQVYAVRDWSYVKNLLTELASEDGRIELFYEGSQLKGIRADWGWEEKEQRLLYVPDDWMEKRSDPKPAIMARIVNMKEFLQLFSLKPDTKQDTEVLLEIEDPLISHNNGLWRWNLTQNGAECEKLLQKPEKEPDLKCLTDQLMQWLMGYEESEKIFLKNCPGLLWQKQINIFQGIFLDEEV